MKFCKMLGLSLKKQLKKPRLAEDVSKKNPVIALNKEIHKKVNKAQRNLDIANQTEIENIEANIKTLEDTGIAKISIDEIAKLAKEQAKNIGF